MITKNIIKQPKSIIEITITVPWIDLQTTWDQILQRMASDVELSGFRKGQAPLPMVEQQLGTRLQDEVLKTAMPNFLIEALKGTDIIPIDYPKYDLISFVKGNQLQFKATITNRPAVTVGNYKTIKVTRSAPKAVTGEEVQKVIDDLYKRWKTRNPVGQDSGVANASQNDKGTQGSINFQGGNKQSLPSYESKIATSPSAPQSDMGGGQTDTPNDEFAKAMGALSLSDLKSKIRKDLESNVSYNNELDFEEAILQEVEKVTTVELPEILIQDELNRMLVSLQRRVADMGLLLEDYLKSQGKTLEQIKSEWRVQAEKNVRMELGLAEVARQENVTISDAELQAEVDKIQDNKVKQQFEAQEPRLHLRHALRQTRTLDLLKKMVGG
ncbi:MAG: trigger factor [Candidatus Daviesbacteria bacterium]|nr:trigger factor [Candidatus Daviesbacteria bacterium]